MGGREGSGGGERVSLRGEAGGVSAAAVKGIWAFGNCVVTAESCGGGRPGVGIAGTLLLDRDERPPKGDKRRLRAAISPLWGGCIALDIPRWDLGGDGRISRGSPPEKT